MARPEDQYKSTALEAPLLKTAHEGDFIRAGLRELFTATGFNSDLITTHGAACFDVEYGPEAVALKPYRPARLFLAEYLGMDENSEIKRLAMEINGEGMNTEIYGNNFASAIARMKQKLGGQRLGLATLISMWPEDAHEDTIASFLEGAGGLLHRGGLVFLTLREPQLYDRLDRVSRRNIGNLDLGVRNIEVLDEYSVYGLKR